MHFIPEDENDELTNSETVFFYQFDEIQSKMRLTLNLFNEDFPNKVFE